jgi:hypothetical protein
MRQSTIHRISNFSSPDRKFTDPIHNQHACARAY